ncbi:MAG: LysM peptidoglycan-binding domain-containing protein [Cyclobacteriaceae bacterium]|nr:LysM peptidoglycan-binding domain-containing protein [Cyclobacteriaceae bacterium]
MASIKTGVLKVGVTLVLSFFAFPCLAQNPLPPPDTVLLPVMDTLAVADEVDTLQLLPVFPGDVEFIPGDDTPELLSDRLLCIQQQIPLTYNTTVHGFIDYFTVRNRDYTRAMQRKKDLYFPLFEKYLALYNLPDELKYLSIIESGLNPRAVSRARAVGLWQFMSGTGRYFGLQTDWYIDDRMDPEKSTEAACRYLSQLHTIFGNWELALAAYNSGPGTVRKAVRKSGYKKSFWEVYPHLPRETRAYVPQFIAIIYAMNYAEHHNMLETVREQFPPYDTLSVNHHLHLGTLARLTGTCLEDMQKLNPAIRHNIIPGNGKTYTVKIPVYSKIILDSNRVAILDSAMRVGKKESAVMMYAAAPANGTTTIYKVAPGDVLGGIALRFNVSVGALKEWNNLTSNTIYAGQKLYVYAPAQPIAKKVVEPISLSPDTKTYIVQPGDTLWDISRKAGLTVEQIKNLNNLKNNNLQPGQKLIVG